MGKRGLTVHRELSTDQTETASPTSTNNQQGSYKPAQPASHSPPKRPYDDALGQFLLICFIAGLVAGIIDGAIKEHDRREREHQRQQYFSERF